MRWWNRIKSSPLAIKLWHWEYWPFEVIYAPGFIYYLYLSLRAKSPFFFSAANPGIENGGMMGESKINILKKIPAHLIPKTLFFSLEEGTQNLRFKLEQAGITFPVIAKPNIGSRGFLVRKIQNYQELIDYLKRQKVDFIIQEYVDYPLEISVMYHRFPHRKQGKITSITLKKYLSVTGDGVSTVLELIQQYDRAKLQLDTLKVTHKHLLDQVPKKGEVLELVPIGNHCRGAAFYNGNHLADAELTSVFDGISRQLKGIYFGRFDMKCQSITSLKVGKQFKILEINGVGAEPAHIYHPGYSLLQANLDIFKQWKTIFRLSLHNKRQGAAFMSLKEAYRMRIGLFAYKKLARS